LELNRSTAREKVPANSLRQAKPNKIGLVSVTRSSTATAGPTALVTVVARLEMPLSTGAPLNMSYAPRVLPDRYETNSGSLNPYWPSRASSEKPHRSRRAPILEGLNKLMWPAVSHPPLTTEQSHR